MEVCRRAPLTSQVLVFQMFPLFGPTQKKDWLSRHLLLLARRGNALEEFDFRWRTAQRSQQQTEARFFLIFFLHMCGLCETVPFFFR